MSKPLRGKKKGTTFRLLVSARSEDQMKSLFSEDSFLKQKKVAPSLGPSKDPMWYAVGDRQPMTGQ